jgi:hypothetical protein
MEFDLDCPITYLKVTINEYEAFDTLYASTILKVT